MLKKVSDLAGAALDYAVALAEGCVYGLPGTIHAFSPSTNWSQGGPIIARENIVLNPQYPTWASTMRHAVSTPNTLSLIYNGPTPLIAAMRCYVASKFGDTINLEEPK